MLRDALLHIGQNFPTARGETYANHPLAEFIRTDFRNALRAGLGEVGLSLSTKGGAGSGQWPTVPWGAVFNPLVTDSATRGYYAVYLFSVAKPEVYLSLNQGATAVMREFGARGRQVLQDRAALMRARLPEFFLEFDCHELDLGSALDLPRGYEAGHAFGRRYDLRNMASEDVLRTDLQRITRAYWTLVYRGGLEPTPEVGVDEESPRGAATLTEVRQYKMHRRIDRHPKASKEAKKYHGTICQACGFDFSKKYGHLGDGFIEAHHCKPLGLLEEGVPVEYNVATDFAVLCSNCHKMIHRTDDPSDIKSFQAKLQRE